MLRSRACAWSAGTVGREEVAKNLQCSLTEALRRACDVKRRLHRTQGCRSHDL